MAVMDGAIANIALPPVGHRRARHRARHCFDASAALLSALSFGLLAIGIDGYARGERAVAALELAASVGCGVWLTRRELRRTAPPLPVDLLRIPVFRLSILTSICSFSAATLAFVSLPFALQGAMGWDATATGLLITPFPVAIACTAPITGRLADRVCAGMLGGIGLAVFAVGLLLALLDPPAAAGAIV